MGIGPHRKAFLLISVVILLFGCRTSPTEDDPDAIAIPFSTDKDTYGVQDEITVVMENNMPDPIFRGACLGLEQRQEGVWESVGWVQNCDGSFYPLQVGRQSQQTFSSVGTRYGTGVYRIKRQVLLQQDWRQVEDVITNVFTIVP